MAETQYEVIESKPVEFPPRNLIRISGPRNLDASLEPFDPNTYRKNQAEMQKTYSHPQTGERISFRPATTAESILIASCDFEHRAKPNIFNPRWLQSGYIIRAQDGVFINPLVQRDNKGNPVIDESELKSLIDISQKVNGIYLLENGKAEAVRDFAFVPYKSFSQEVQDSEDFARSGIARGLEYAAGEEAPLLRQISSRKYYPNGVNVLGFDRVKEPVLRVAGLNSDWYGGCRLSVNGSWSDGYAGFAFGGVASCRRQRSCAGKFRVRRTKSKRL